MLHQIIFGRSTISFSLEYRERKSLRIQVYPDNAVHVIAPMDADLIVVKEKVKSKAPWILKQQDYFLAFHPLTPPRKYVSGETHLYLGRQYRLKVIEDNTTQSTKLKQGYLTVHTPKKNEKTIIEKQVKTWYTQKAQLHFPTLLEKVLPKFKRYGIKKPILTIQYMEKRWGSCIPSGKIILNTELIKASKSDIEYVIIHELCHLIHPNHSTAYFELLDTMLPTWKKTKQHLEELVA